MLVLLDQGGNPAAACSTPLLQRDWALIPAAVDSPPLDLPCDCFLQRFTLLMLDRGLSFTQQPELLSQDRLLIPQLAHLVLQLLILQQQLVVLLLQPSCLAAGLYGFGL